MAGIAILIIQIQIVAQIIPGICGVNIPTKKMAKDPLIPNSANVVVGTIVIKK